MKNIQIFKSITYLFIAILFASCETIELDKAQDPFNLTPDKANVDFVFNAIEENFAGLIDGGDYANTGLGNFGGQLTRVYGMNNGNSDNYASVFQPSASDSEFTTAYIGILANIRLMTPLAAASNRKKHIAIAQFIEAYTITTLVDFYGDIPYSQAGVAGILNPKLDSGASVYAAALALLDQAIINFGQTSVNPTTEVFYNSNSAQWIKAANTLKMRLYLQTRLVDATAISKFNTIIASGNFISSSADDLVYRWSGTSASNPDSRHPKFVTNYTTTGSSDYMSNWMMGSMSSSNDPRIRYYYYRQRSGVPGQGSNPPSEITLRCSLVAAPAHYISGGYTYCGLPNGYWGRDHGDNEGTPPDGFLKTTFGIYPAGGKFDGDNFSNITITSGAGGKGITPILLASWVDFMKAEVAASQGDFGTAKVEMLSGINKSIVKVMSFGLSDAAYNAAFAPTAAQITSFSNAVSTSWDSGTNAQKYNILGTQYFRAVFGNGIESYNFYRRTGYPTNLQPNRNPTPGNFMRSMYYPASSVNNNSNVAQKPNQSVPVFWNSNSSPIAN